MRFLVTADVHLGRASSRVSGEGHSALDAWLRLCRTAVEHDVAAVLVAGDLADEETAYPVALRAMESAREILGERPVWATAGNHDPTVVSLLHKGGLLRQLGAGGRWEVAEIGGIRIVGWSFASKEVTNSAFAQAPPPGDLGLIHADVDVLDSRYHPVRRRELEDAPVRAWAVGHIHTFREGMNWRYVTSPQALDPGETGAHSAWLVNVEPGETPRWEPVAPSTVRYEWVEVDVTGLDEEGAIVRRDERLEVEYARARAAGARRFVARVRFTGASAASPKSLEGARYESPDVTLDRAEADGVFPPVDLEDLARGKGARASLARLIGQLDAGGPLAEDARARLRAVTGGVERPDETAFLRRAATRVLGDLLRTGGPA